MVFLLTIVDQKNPVKVVALLFVDRTIPVHYPGDKWRSTAWCGRMARSTAQYRLRLVFYPITC